jgi:DNA-binding CsgD family transcriptional regulator
VIAVTTGIVGREEELASIEAFLARVEDGPGALVISGEAGIGKTVLWERAVEEAERRLGRVLICRGAEAEASFAFASLSELLVGVVDEVLPVLPSPRRRALEVALQLTEPGEAAPDSHAIGLALLDVLRVLSEPGPILLALDDLQWLDAASAGVLSVAVRRLRAEQVGVLATVRQAAGTSAFSELERSFPDELRAQLDLPPLSLGALHHLLQKRVGLDLTRPELGRVRDASAGNPFFAIELGRELVRTGTRPAAGRALRVPKSLHELLGSRLSRLPAETMDVLLPAAALARPTVQTLAAACADERRVIEALEAAVGEGVIELDDSRLSFAHPLLASICYEQAPVWKRRAAHRALAGAVSGAEERARHLALATEGSDERIASELDAAADRAAARGAPVSAAELCELAAELTAADPLAARRRRLNAARLHTVAGDPDRAVVLLDELLSEVPSGVERADILLARIFTTKGDTRVLVTLCGAALDAAVGDDVRSARILALRSWVHLMEADARSAVDDARSALQKAERSGDPGLLAAVIGRVVQAESWAADVTPGLIDRGVEIEERLGLSLDWRESPRLYVPRLLVRQGEIERPRVLLEELEASAAARGHETTRMLTLWYLSMLEWLAGRWQQALDRASAALELAEGGVHSGWPGRVKALVEVDLGLLPEARSSAEHSLVYSQGLSNEIFSLLILGVLGRLELVQTRLPEAADYLRDLPARLLAGGVNDPMLTVWADAIEVLIALGEIEQARSYLEQYELNAQRLPSPWAIAAAARCRGLLEAAGGDRAAAVAAFDAALSELKAHPYPLERARTLLCLGGARRRAQEKRAAREALEEALAAFEALGARLWAEKARAELRRIGGRAPASDGLTETERRVAELAARGRSNREIAAELFMGVSTVEAHLSRVYRKLGVRRAGLAGRLAEPTDPAAGGMSLA